MESLWSSTESVLAGNTVLRLRLRILTPSVGGIVLSMIVVDAITVIVQYLMYVLLTLLVAETTHQDMIQDCDGLQDMA